MAGLALPQKSNNYENIELGGLNREGGVKNDPPAHKGLRRVGSAKRMWHRFNGKDKKPVGVAESLKVIALSSCTVTFCHPPTAADFAY